MHTGDIFRCNISCTGPEMYNTLSTSVAGSSLQKILDKKRSFIDQEKFRLFFWRLA